jgi:hypothetical protein
MKSKISNADVLSGGKSHFNQLAIIVLVGLLAWGLVLFTDYLLYDSWWTCYLLQNKDKFWCFEQICHEIGRPLDIFFFWPLTFFNDPVFVAKVVGVCSHVAQACLFSMCLQVAFCISKIDATWIAAIGIALPFFDLCGEICLFMYGTAPLLFWVAWLILLQCDWKFNMRFFLLRLLVLGLFFFSFNLNSLLPFFYSFAGVFFISDWRKNPNRSLQQQIIISFRRFWDVYLLPLVFWSWKIIFCPLQGIYAEWEYNKINFDLSILIKGYTSFFNMFAGEIREVFALGWSILALLLLLSVICSYLVLKKVRFSSEKGSKDFFWNLENALYGFTLLMASAFPYVVTGKLFSENDWDSRNAVLVALPAGMVIFFLIKTARALILPKSELIPFTIVFYFILAGVVSANCSTLRLQAMGAKQQSLSNKLKTVISETPLRAISLRDYYHIPATIYFYPHIMWTYICTDFHSVPKVLVVDTRFAFPDQIKVNPDGTRETVIPIIHFDDRIYEHFVKYAGAAFSFAEPPSSKDSVTAIVTQGEQGVNGVSIGARYLFSKYFEPNGLKKYIQSITKVIIVDRDNKQKVY